MHTRSDENLNAMAAQIATASAIDGTGPTVIGATARCTSTATLTPQIVPTMRPPTDARVSKMLPCETMTDETDAQTGRGRPSDAASRYENVAEPEHRNTKAT